ncbi:MAG TPA: glycosyl transferase [Clostridiales bacterium]|nr:glycosyl transferase [Clostridiales bacterium]
MAKILMINLPYTGHTNPTLGLAKKLVERGHIVDYILSNDWREKIAATGATFIPYDNYPNDLSFSKAKILCFRAAYETALRIGKDYDIIIYEFLFFLGKSLGDKLKKPVVRQFTTFALNENSFTYMADRIMKLNILNRCSVLRSLVTKLFFAPKISMKENDFVKEILFNKPDLNIVYIPREFQIFENEFEDSEYSFVGPSICERIETQVIPFHEMKHPIIYVSLGTIFNNNKSFYLKCIKAFCKNSATLILSIGSKIKIEDFYPLPKNCYVYNHVPQLEVLEQADLFITHGGMNSINEAMYYGVPMLVFPYATDQPANADRIAELGLGKRMKTSMSGERIMQSAFEVLEDKKIRSSVNEMSMKVKAYGGLEQATKLIEKYLNIINYSR